MTDEEWAAIKWVDMPTVVVVPKNPAFDSWFFSGCTWNDSDGLLRISKGVDVMGTFRVEELIGWYDSSTEVPDNLNEIIRNSNAR